MCSLQPQGYQGYRNQSRQSCFALAFGERISFVFFLQQALIDQLQYGSRQERPGYTKNKCGLLKILYGAILLYITYNSRRERLQGKLVQQLADASSVLQAKSNPAT